MTHLGLPAGWKLSMSLDLNRDAKPKRQILLLSLAVTLGTMLAGAAHCLLAAGPLAGGLPQAALVGLGTPLDVLGHEGVHGAVIGGLTKRRPRFGLTGGYAWTGLPEAYFDRRDYLLVALSPVVVWGAAFFIALGCFPALAPAFWLLQAVNLGGAAGDYYVAWTLLTRLPRETLCQDTGVAMAFYEREEQTHAGEK